MSGDYILAAFGEANENGLTPTGRMQVERLAKKIMEKRDRFDTLDFIGCSPEQAAKQSAEIFLRYHKPWPGHPSSSIEMSCLAFGSDDSLVETFAAFSQIPFNDTGNTLVVASPRVVKDIAFYTLQVHNFLERKKQNLGINKNGLVLDGKEIPILSGSAVTLNYARDEWNFINQKPLPVETPPAKKDLEDMATPYQRMKDDGRRPVLYLIHDTCEGPGPMPKGVLIGMMPATAREFAENLPLFLGGNFRLEGRVYARDWGIGEVRGAIGDTTKFYIYLNGVNTEKKLQSPSVVYSATRKNIGTNDVLYVGNWKKDSRSSGSFTLSNNPELAGIKLVR